MKRCKDCVQLKYLDRNITGKCRSALKCANCEKKKKRAMPKYKPIYNTVYNFNVAPWTVLLNSDNEVDIPQFVHHAKILLQLQLYPDSDSYPYSYLSVQSNSDSCLQSNSDSCVQSYSCLQSNSDLQLDSYSHSQSNSDSQLDLPDIITPEELGDALELPDDGFTI